MTALLLNDVNSSSLLHLNSTWRWRQQLKRQFRDWLQGGKFSGSMVIYHPCITLCLARDAAFFQCNYPVYPNRAGLMYLTFLIFSKSILPFHRMNKKKHFPVNITCFSRDSLFLFMCAVIIFAPVILLIKQVQND